MVFKVVEEYRLVLDELVDVGEGCWELGREVGRDDALDSALDSDRDWAREGTRI